MYMKTVKKQSGVRYYQLVESYRNKEGQPRQRVLLPLGRVGEGKLDQLEKALKKYTGSITALEKAHQVDVEKTYILGPLLVLEFLFKQFQLKKLFQNIQKTYQKLTIDLEKVVFSLIACRFVRPTSKLKIFEQGQRQLDPHRVKEVSLHHIYRTLDYLSDSKDEIEKLLYHRDKSLFNQKQDVVLYDLTTLYFESRRTDRGDLRQFGFSKDKKSESTQVVLGLLVEPNGLPLGFEVYPGNTFEGHTISSIVKKLREKLSINRFIFVGDRGLFSKQNLEEIKQDGGEFLVGMKTGSLKEKNLEELYNKSKMKWLSKNIGFYETTKKSHRCIVVWSAKRTKEDARKREQVLGRIRQKLKMDQEASKKNPVSLKDFVSNKAYKKYVTYSGAKPSLNEKAIKKAQLREGFFALITNIQKREAKDLISDYKQLWIVEDAFGELKGTLQARPVYHWTDKRIRGHLVLCFLCYFLEAEMTRLLREKNVMMTNSATQKNLISPRPLTVKEILSGLSEVRSIPVRLEKRTTWVRTEIQGHILKLLRALGVAIPSKILKIDSV